MIMPITGTLLCLIIGGGGILEKNPQVYLIIIREWPKNNPLALILRNLDNFPLVHFIRSPSPYNSAQKSTSNSIINFLSKPLLW